MEVDDVTIKLEPSDDGAVEATVRTIPQAQGSNYTYNNEERLVESEQSGKNKASSGAVTGTHQAKVVDATCEPNMDDVETNNSHLIKNQSISKNHFKLDEGMYICCNCHFKDANEESVHYHFQMAHKKCSAPYNDTVPGDLNTHKPTEHSTLMEDLIVKSEVDDPAILSVPFNNSSVLGSTIQGCMNTGLIKSESDSPVETIPVTFISNISKCIESVKEEIASLSLLNSSERGLNSLKFINYITGTDNGSDAILQPKYHGISSVRSHLISFRAETLTYECGRCNLIVMSFEKGMCHIRKKHEHKTAYCFACNYSTNNLANMEQHIESHINDVNSLKGDSTFDMKELFQCPKCSYNTSSMILLKNHCVVMHIRKLLYCLTCNQEFHFTAELKAHIRKVHSLDVYKTPVERKLNIIERSRHILKHSVNVLESPSLFKCLHCSFYTRYKPNLQSHLQLLHKFESNATKSKTLQSLVATNVSSDNLATRSNLNGYKCNYCNFTDLFKKNIKTHVLLTHADIQKYLLCDLCGTYFISERGRKRHIQKIHTKQNKLSCMHCKFSTTSIESLQVHMQNHTSHPMELCYVCGYAARCSKRMMDIHIAKHFDLKPHACNICDFRTSTRSILSKHMYTHTEERPYKCEECGHCSKNNDYFRLHMLTHAADKQFSCKYCDYRCRRGFLLTRHMKVHSSQTYFECDKCPRKFKAARGLKLHAPIHSDIKPFGCNICPFRTHRMNCLHMHNKQHEDNSRYHCFNCNYNSTTRSNFTEHVHKTCPNAKHKNVYLMHCFYCSYKSTHRSNFITHVNGGCAKQKTLLKGAK